MRHRVELRGLTVLITGAASGIGRQLAFDLRNREHCRLVLFDRDAAALERVRVELGGSEWDVRVHVCDVGSTPSVAKALEELEDVSIDILVNNAGVLHAGPFESMPIEEFERLVNVNLLGSVRVARLTMPWLIRSPSATIVNVASLAGLVASPGMSAYSASKFGLVGFSEALRVELGGRIHVCVVCPSFVRTGFVNTARLEGGSRQAEVMNDVLHKLGSHPSKTSQAIIRGIKRQERVVLVNPDAHLFYALKRLLPSMSDAVLRSIYNHLSQRWAKNA